MGNESMILWPTEVLIVLWPRKPSVFLAPDSSICGTERWSSQDKIKPCRAVRGQGSHLRGHIPRSGVMKRAKCRCFFICQNLNHHLDPGWGFKKIIPSDCQLKTPCKNWILIFFSGEFLGSFACLGASNSLIFVVQIPVWIFCWFHYQFSWVQFPFQTRLFDWFNTHNHVYSTSFVGFIVWSFIWICLTI